MNIRESLNNLFPNKDPEHKLSVKEMNKRARAKADKEELAKMKYVKHLNYINKKNRTGGLRKYDIWSNRRNFHENKNVLHVRIWIKRFI